MGNISGEHNDMDYDGVDIAIEDFEEEELTLHDSDDFDELYDKDEPFDALSTDIELPPTSELSAELDYEEAENLTITIRNAANMLWFLILKAYHGKAWKVLGYKSWGDYVTEEFDMSRSRSYQILDQAKVIQAIENVTPEGTHIDLNEASARELKYVLDEILPEIEERTAGLSPEEAQEVLHQIVNETRETIKNDNKKLETDNAEQTSELYDVDEWGNIINPETDIYPHPQTDNLDTTTTNKDEEEGDDGFLNDEPWGNDDNWETHNNPNNSDGPVKSVDPTQGLNFNALKNYADAAQNVFIAITSLSELPHDIESITTVISEERERFIDDNLDLAEVNFALFVEKWRNRKKN